MGDDRRRSRTRRAGRRPRERFEDLDDRYDEYDDYDDEPEPPPRRGARRRAGGRRGSGMDWDAADDDRYDEPVRDDDDYDDYDDDDRKPRRRIRRREKKARRETRSLMSLCTPIFGCAAVLPREEGDPQPEYLQFRQQVVTALQDLEKQAADNRIDGEDVKEASYALALFMDEQVVGSEWEAKEQWAAEPLHIVLHQDAEGGVNFFRRLESFGDRQGDVKEVYLVCLALGFRGKYAAEELRRQATRIDEIKQSVLKSIRPASMDKEEMLFPDAYRVADQIEDEVEPPPRWWLYASLGTVAVSLLLWVAMFFIAGRVPADARNAAREEVRSGAVEARDPVPPEPLVIDGEDQAPEDGTSYEEDTP